MKINLFIYTEYVNMELRRSKHNWMNSWLIKQTWKIICNGFFIVLNYLNAFFFVKTLNSVLTIFLKF